ncbi:hypothetical protein JAAARDRAFT_117279 [Jaapia argillacea MUCL 33604]|uniref:Reverse transcriptase zinc-binding domain-containing protein n=1 Tax=Jaapia argillacea MUCL 33604 TaxID=933084 RepID=A0A067QDV8_9AGAM|nr:hypothetical protein JAAARDRAFT_117279 [Jaapia argillacea MUCL 33604]
MTHSGRTVISLDKTRHALRENLGGLPKDSTIWKGCRSPDIQLKIWQFLFLSIHQTQKIGEYWRNIPGYEQRGICSVCRDDEESMEHIMLICRAQEGPLIWDLAKGLWPASHGEWPQLTIRSIMACGSLKIKPANNGGNANQEERRNNAKMKGASRLLRILVSESAHLIWAIRCLWVIQDVTLTVEVMQQRWLTAIGWRLTIDRIIAARRR